MRKEGRTAAAPKPVANYSQAVQIDSLVSVSGQTGVVPDTGVLVSGGLADQMDQVRANIEAALESRGASLGDVIRADVFLKDLADFEHMNTHYRSWFDPPYPSRTTVGCQLSAGVLVEVTVLAVLSVKKWQPGA